MSAPQFIYIEPASDTLLLAQMNFLADLPPADWRQILLPSVRVVALGRGQDLYVQGQPLDHIYILLEGRVRQFREETVAPDQTLFHERTVDRAGTILSIYGLMFYDDYRTTTREAGNGTCRLLQFDASAFNRLIFRFPDLRQALVNMALIRRLNTMPMLGHLDLELLGFLSEEATETLLETGDIVYSEGEIPKVIYFVDQGQIALDWEDGQTGWAANGAAFGLVNDEPMMGAFRANARPMMHTARATTQTTIISIPLNLFRSITCRDPDEIGLANMERRKDVVNGLPIFARLSQAQRDRLVGFFSDYYFPINQLLVQQGEQADSFWVLLHGGSATIQALDEDGRRLTSTISLGNTMFCETALLGEVAQESSVEAMGNSEWLRLHWRDFQHFDDEYPEEIRDLLEVSTDKLKSLESQEKRERHSWLQPGEMLIVQSRRHWIAFLSKGVPALITMALLVGLGLLVSRIPGVQTAAVIIGGILASLVLLLFVWAAIDYFNDWIAVTNRRVVYQEKLIFVRRRRDEAPLDQIEQVDQDRNLLGGWLNYGTAIIQTASSAGKIVFTYTRNFDQLNDAIRTQQEQRQHHSVAESKSKITKTLSDRLGHWLVLPSRVWMTPKPEPEIKWWHRFVPHYRRNYAPPDDGRIVWRKHWPVLLPQLTGAAISLFITMILMALSVFIANRAPSEYQRPGIILEVVVGILLTYSVLRVAWVIVNWYNDTYEVDDQRITHIERLPFNLRMRTSGALLERIQNVSSETPSTIHMLLNYGNVRCQTAAEDGDFLFDGVHNPRKVADIIQLRMEYAGQNEAAREAERRMEDLPDWFEIYHKMETDDIPL